MLPAGPKECADFRRQLEPRRVQRKSGREMSQLLHEIERDYREISLNKGGEDPVSILERIKKKKRG